MKISVFWFRRDLRLEDNTALHAALTAGLPVLPVFIFDEHILEELPRDDARVGFIHERLAVMNRQLNERGSSIWTYIGDPVRAWEKILTQYEVDRVYLNKDYEPYATDRDARVRVFLEERGVAVRAYKDQVLFEENEVVKEDGRPYTVYTPYKNKWLHHFHQRTVPVREFPGFDNFLPSSFPFPGPGEIGFQPSPVRVREHDLSRLDQYAATRDFPGMDNTSYLSPHLRFGTISIRQVVGQLEAGDSVFLGELIWREFFMQILWHFPDVVDRNFNARYNGIIWRNDEQEFGRWCRGETGYPLVDAGMRQLNTTGYMHNRVRMVAASFLCKHLLIDWRWGEAYFALKLLDYELSSNNGNWQWAAGTGCDAAPYFRVFNPAAQLEKFDRERTYTRKWVPALGTAAYPVPVVDHQSARERALETYKKALKNGGI
jgi:deoxyribodipyrimidine photo-lyase